MLTGFIQFLGYCRPGKLPFETKKMENFQEISGSDWTTCTAWLPQRRRLKFWGLSSMETSVQLPPAANSHKECGGENGNSMWVTNSQKSGVYSKKSTWIWLNLVGGTLKLCKERGRITIGIFLNMTIKTQKLWVFQTTNDIACFFSSFFVFHRLFITTTKWVWLLHSSYAKPLSPEYRKEKCVFLRPRRLFFPVLHTYVLGIEKKLAIRLNPTAITVENLITRIKYLLIK